MNNKILQRCIRMFLVQTIIDCHCNMHNIIDLHNEHHRLTWRHHKHLRCGYYMMNSIDLHGEKMNFRIFEHVPPNIFFWYFQNKILIKSVLSWEKIDLHHLIVSEIWRIRVVFCDFTGSGWTEWTKNHLENHQWTWLTF